MSDSASACRAPDAVASLPDWDAPLWDSDGTRHTLVAKSTIEVVTRVSFTFAVWDRRTGAMLYPLDASTGKPYELTLRNTPVDEPPAKEDAVFCVASSESEGARGLFNAGPYPTVELARDAAGLDEKVFRVTPSGRPELVR